MPLFKKVLRLAYAGHFREIDIFLRMQLVTRWCCTYEEDPLRGRMEVRCEYRTYQAQMAALGWDGFGPHADGRLQLRHGRHRRACSDLSAKCGINTTTAHCDSPCLPEPHFCSGVESETCMSTLVRNELQRA